MNLPTANKRAQNRLPAATRQRIKALIAKAEVPHWRVAFALGMNPSHFSHVLNGRRSVRDSFEEEVVKAVTKLEEAEE